MGPAFEVMKAQAFRPSYSSAVIQPLPRVRRGLVESVFDSMVEMFSPPEMMMSFRRRGFST